MKQKTNLGTLYASFKNELKLSGIESASIEARILLTHSLNISDAIIIGYPETLVDSEYVDILKSKIKRRKSGEPISYIVGSREFWSLDFKVTPDTLIPRQESELLIDLALQNISDRRLPLSILDLGTGSGCLLLSLLSELPFATGIGIDISQPALDVAIDNAKTLNLSSRVSFQNRDWFEGMEGQFDLILSNPPYIKISQISDLETQIKDFEPVLALNGGDDGLEHYRRIGQGCAKKIATSGFLLLEIGANQAGDVSDILLKSGLSKVKIYKDFSNLERCILATV
jgi:release factor glutamine methyltransferase